MGFLGKQIAKFGLSMHFGTSRHYARVIRRLAKGIKGDVNKEHEYAKKLDEAINNRSIEGIKESMYNLIEDCKAEAKKLDHISEEVYVLEFRMEKDLNALVKDLEEIKKNPNTEAKFNENIEVLHKLFSEIRSAIKIQKKKMRDLKRDRDKLRDKSVMPNIMLFHILKVSAKSEKREIKHAKNTLKDLQKVIEELKKGKTSEKAFDRIKSDVVKLRGQIQEELLDLGKIENAVVYLTERLKNLNESEFIKVRNLAQKGFPPKLESDIALREQNFLNQLKEGEKKEFQRAKAVLGLT